MLVRGAFIRTDEIQDWQHALDKLLADLQGEATLECMEPEIAVSLRAKSLGAIEKGSADHARPIDSRAPIYFCHRPKLSRADIIAVRTVANRLSNTRLLKVCFGSQLSVTLSQDSRMITALLASARFPAPWDRVQV